MLKITKRSGGQTLLSSSGILQVWVITWTASSFDMSGTNHWTTRRKNWNNCFLNTKTSLKIVISFSIVSFPAGRVEVVPLNFVATSLISQNIPPFIPLSLSLSHTDTRARTHHTR
jgi:hypothetical protein